MAVLPFILIGVALIVAVAAWLRSKRNDPYDLKKLWDEPEPLDPVEEPLDEDSGPYCHSCDEPHGPGTNFCRHCGRKLG